jgi:hypothetical protein
MKQLRKMVARPLASSGQGCLTSLEQKVLWLVSYDHILAAAVADG